MVFIYKLSETIYPSLEVHYDYFRTCLALFIVSQIHYGGRLSYICMLCSGDPIARTVVEDNFVGFV